MWMRELYELHGRALYRYLLGLSYGQPQLAEDLVQETLLRAWRNIESLNPDATVLLPWLFTVARRVAIDAARARKVRPAQSDDADVAELAVDADPIEGVLTAHTVRRALPRISPEHRQVVIELYYRGRTVAEASRRLGIPEGTVKSRAHHALRALKAAIGTLHGDDS
jgi:RNA polymerase sigma-70 factor, ECF subfamily